MPLNHPWDTCENKNLEINKIYIIAFIIFRNGSSFDMSEGDVQGQWLLVSRMMWAERTDGGRISPSLATV